LEEKRPTMRMTREEDVEAAAGFPGINCGASDFVADGPQEWPDGTQEWPDETPAGSDEASAGSDGPPAGLDGSPGGSDGTTAGSDGTTTAGSDGTIPAGLNTLTMMGPQDDLCSSKRNNGADVLRPPVAAQKKDDHWSRRLSCTRDDETAPRKVFCVRDLQRAGNHSSASCAGDETSRRKIRELQRGSFRRLALGLVPFIIILTAFVHQIYCMFVLYSLESKPLRNAEYLYFGTCYVIYWHALSTAETSRLWESDCEDESSP
jgi:hypothetical protein